MESMLFLFSRSVVVLRWDASDFDARRLAAGINPTSGQLSFMRAWIAPATWMDARLGLAHVIDQPRKSRHVTREARTKTQKRTTTSRSHARIVFEFLVSRSFFVGLRTFRTHAYIPTYARRALMEFDPPTASWTRLIN
jgi:hypothetical protein